MLEAQIKDLEANISSQFSDLRQLPYQLSSVFIHVGSHNAGHYWIYIYDFNKKIWRKYNDEKVTEVRDMDEIFKQDSGVRPPTPYFLVYVKDDIKEALVDPVCRDVIEASPGQSQDIVMEDYVDIATCQDVPNVYQSLNTLERENPPLPPERNWDNSQIKKYGYSW